MMCSSGALLFPQRLRSNSMEPAPGSVCFVPVYVAFACQTCDAPGDACRHCGGICCISCSMGCATQLQPDSQDSPRAIETVQHCTGGTEDHELKDNTVYSLLESFFASSNHWHWVEESLYIRSQPLPELGVCYITGEDLSPRPLGTMGDWIRIAGVLSYHHAALVVFNLEDKKTFIFEIGKQPYRAAPKSALRILRSSPTGLGLSMTGEGVHAFTHIEAWWSVDEARPMKKQTVRDKLAMAVVRSNNHVEYWWP